MIQFKPDHKTGMALCQKLLKKNMREKDKEFVNSILQQILDKPLAFEMSDKQGQWMSDIYARYIPKSER
jgi:hypothetical protein